MKPSPMLEEIKRLLRACIATEGECVPDAVALARKAPALLALISAQPGVSPGGEGVTREVLYRFMWDRVYRWVNDLQIKRDIEEAVSVLHKEFIILPRPTSHDPARATEELEGK